MNWTKAQYEYRAAQNVSYGERMDEAEDRWAERDAEREARRAVQRRTSSQANLPKGELLALNHEAQKMGIDLSKVSWTKMLRLFSQLEADAKRYRIDPRELRRRRLRVMRNYSVDSVLAAGRLDSSPKREPARKKAAPPISTRERLRQEAERQGTSIQALVAPDAQRAASSAEASRLISSAGRNRATNPASTKPPARPASEDAGLTKKQEKQRRDQEAAKKLGITLKELRTRRRLEHEANVQRKTKGGDIGTRPVRSE